MDPIREDNGLLEISTRFLSDEDVTNFVKRVNESTTITTLDFHYVTNTDERLKKLCEGITNPRLTTVKLREDRIGNEGAMSLSKLTNLVTLDVSYNLIGDEGAIALSKIPKLKSLHLQDNAIGDEGAIALLTNLPKLKSLDLRWNYRIVERDALYCAFESHPTLFDFRFDFRFDKDERIKEIKNRKRMRAFREVVKSLNDNVTSKILRYL